MNFLIFSLSLEWFLRNISQTRSNGHNYYLFCEIHPGKHIDNLAPNRSSNFARKLFIFLLYYHFFTDTISWSWTKKNKTLEFYPISKLIDVSTGRIWKIHKKGNIKNQPRCKNKSFARHALLRRSSNLSRYVFLSL